MTKPDWWLRLRSKLKHNKKDRDDRSTDDEKPQPLQSLLSSEQTTYAAGVDASSRDPVPYDSGLHDALISAAPSEPASLASTAVSASQGGTLLFAQSSLHVGAGLLPRMAQPASGQSVYVGETQPPVVVDPSFDNQSVDGRQETAAPEELHPSRETQPMPDPAPVDTQPKLTAATLGTHSTLSEGVVKAHRSQRKMHFIKNWLNDAQAEAEAAMQAAAEAEATAAALHSPPAPMATRKDPSRPQAYSMQHAAAPAGPHGASYDAQPSTAPVKRRPSGSPLQASDAAHSYHRAPSLEVSRSQQDSSVSAATPAAGTSVTSGAPTSSITTTMAPLPHHLSAPSAQGHTSPMQPWVTSSTVPMPRAVAVPEPTQPALMQAFLQTPTLSASPQLAQDPSPQHALPTGQRPSFSRPQVHRATSQTAAVNAGASLAAELGSGLVLTPSAEHDSVGGMGRYQSRGESEQLETYLASAATTMTVTSQVEGPDIPNRVAVPSTCSAVIAAQGSSRPVESPAPALRLPSAASHESTKTIAVAGHCPEDMAAQQWSVDDFILQRKLYEGALSVICHAQHKRSGRHVALKIYKRSRLHEMERFQLAREICLHIRILHPHILSLYAAWKDSKYVYLVLEWAPHGNLFELLVSRGGKLPEVEAARHIIRPLLTSLAFLHSHSWLHRDIKLENVLLDAQGMVKLCDFGLAIDQKFEQANTRLGTFGYFAPEVLDCPLKKGPFDFKGEPGVPTYGCKVDVWSMGVMSYELLTGKAPFAASSAAKIIEAIRSRDVQYPATLSAGAKSFLSAALVRDPEQRATAEQLLQHPWILACCGQLTGSLSARTSAGSSMLSPSMSGATC